MAWDYTAETHYLMYDAKYTAPGKRVLEQFQSMTGGDMSISMVTYSYNDANGNVNTKYMPGQISFGPITLSRPMDSISSNLYDWFTEAIDNKVKETRINCSIAMFDPNDVNNLRVIWDLENVMPVAIPGFAFSAITKEISTSFKLVIQAENIIVTFPSA